jgi:alkaline phosphatase
LTGCIVVLALLGCATRGAAPVQRTDEPGRGVILFVGDGMGVASITAARIHKHAAQRTGAPQAGLQIERAPRSCLVRTASLDFMVTDSAAAITAMVTGERVPNGVLSVRVDDAGPPVELRTLLELAEARGLSTGIVTTTTITHATPAGLYAHVARRADEAAIAEALVPSSRNGALGDGIEVILGGGRSFLRPQEAGGQRRDGRDLIAELERAGYSYARDAAETRAAVGSGTDKLLGIFADGHMSFALDRPQSEPDLAEMTSLALDVLRRNPRGYFLMVEGGRIDHAHHVNNARRAIAEVLGLDDAVGAALAGAGAGDVILVTADHDHTMVIAGYPRTEDDIFVQAGVDALGSPYTALLYGNGPSALSPPPAVLGPAELASPDFRERAGVPLSHETHGGMDVPLFVFGPESVYRDLPAVIDNTAIFDILLSALPGGD